MHLSQLLEAVDGVQVLCGNPHALEIARLVFDSREISPGSLFIALRGARADGHRFVAGAWEKGAVAVLVEEPVGDVPPDAVVLRVPDTRVAMAQLATHFHGHPSRQMRLIGVTGTNGKTTTLHMVERILEADGRTSGAIGTINYRWPGTVVPAINTTPENLKLQEMMAQMRLSGVTDLVMEVSSHGLSTHRLEGTAFDVAIFTNLTQDHLDFHGTMEAYEEAKAALFTRLLPQAHAAGKSVTAVVNLDDPAGRRLAARLGANNQIRLLTYALSEPQASLYAEERVASLEGTAMRVKTPAGPLEVLTPMHGEFNASNALAAMGAMMALSVPVDAIVRGLAALDGVPGRLQRVRPNPDKDWGSAAPAVFVDYAHTPDALERTLATVRAICPGRVHVVFGCGGNRDRAKRPLMGEVARRLGHVAWVTSDNPRHEDPLDIIADILRGMQPGVLHEREGARVEEGGALWILPERAQAIAWALAEAGPEDVVVLAGKGHETYQEIGDTRHPFDDVDVARAALYARAARPQSSDLPTTDHK